MTAEEIRQAREVECFKIADRGPLWYDGLTMEQLEELRVWHRAWLAAPETGVIPERLVWIT